MKKRIVTGMLILSLFLLVGCASEVESANKNNTEISKSASSDAITNNSELNCFSIYSDFLMGKLDAGVEENNRIGIQDIFIVEENYNRFTLFDSNRNGVPELHLSTMTNYIIMEFEEDELNIVYTGSGYETLLDNGALLYTRSGGGPEHMSYMYTQLGKDNEITQISFEMYNTKNEDVNDDVYMYDDVEVTQAEFYDKVNKYLSINTEIIIWSDYWTYLVENK